MNPPPRLNQFDLLEDWNTRSASKARLSFVGCVRSGVERGDIGHEALVRLPDYTGLG